MWYQKSRRYFLPSVLPNLSLKFTIWLTAFPLSFIWIRLEVSVCPVYIAAVKSMTKTSLESREFIWLIHPGSLSITEGNQGGNSSRAGSWKQELKERPWRNAAPWLASPGSFSLFFHTSQDYLPRCGSVPRDMGPPTSIINQENAPMVLSTSQSGRDIFSSEIISFPDESSL